MDYHGCINPDIDRNFFEIIGRKILNKCQGKKEWFGKTKNGQMKQ